MLSGMKSSRLLVKSISPTDITPNMVHPPITLQKADNIQRMMKNLLLSFMPNNSEMFIRILTQLIPELVIFSMMDPKTFNDAPMVTTLIVSRITAFISTT